MAVYLANTGVLTVNSVDLSTLVTNVVINRSFDELEITALGDTGHNRLPKRFSICKDTSNIKHYLGHKRYCDF